MRAVVLEIRNGKAAVLREDGTVLKIRGNYAVGETIELKESSFSPMQFRSVLMSFVLIIALVFGSYNYTTVQAAGYITTDEETGIQLVLNRRDQVIDIIASNENGEILKEELLKENVKGKVYAEAVHAVAEYHRLNDGESHELTFHAEGKDIRAAERINQKLTEMRRPFRPDQTDTAEQIQFPEEIQQDRPEFNGLNREEYHGDTIPEETVNQEIKDFVGNESLENIHDYPNEIDREINEIDREIIEVLALIDLGHSALIQKGQSVIN